jgi:hypothetical protein
MLAEGLIARRLNSTSSDEVWNSTKSKQATGIPIKASSDSSNSLKAIQNHPSYQPQSLPINKPSKEIRISLSFLSHFLSMSI